MNTGKRHIKYLLCFGIYSDILRPARSIKPRNRIPSIRTYYFFFQYSSAIRGM